ncbi:MAG: hypothetical protein KBF26_12030 [Opitutaceae bacterium]|nr:hypothetical protein [Opitutaceae bacterium]
MEKKPQISPDDVMAFVGNAHGDFNKVRALLEKEPALINAAWDWGGGDWETALGAAAHTGQREIAVYLLEHGARIDLFAAAMLGRLSIVKAILGEFPEMKRGLGPHGIPLLVHAKMGGEPAAEVLLFLEAP